ncbi:MAG: hypothetical protein ACYCXT_05950 [Acidiferrobacteraceae bacterium]
MTIPRIGSGARLGKRLLSRLGLGAALLSSVAYATSYQFTTLNAPGANLTEAWGINDHGAIVGRYRDSAGNYHGFLDNAGTYTTLGTPGAQASMAPGIDNSGAIIGHYAHSPNGVIDTAGTYTTLSFPFTGTRGPTPTGINNNGDIVGQYADSAYRGHSFLDTGGTFTTLNAPGAEATTLVGTNDHGTLVGTVTVMAAGFRMVFLTIWYGL